MIVTREERSGDLARRRVRVIGVWSQCRELAKMLRCIS